MRGQTVLLQLFVCVIQEVACSVWCEREKRAPVLVTLYVQL